MTHGLLGLCCGAAVLVLGIAAYCDGGNIRRELEPIHLLRKGRETQFEEVERYASKLLETHSAPDERAQIYYTVCVAYASADARRYHDKMVEYATKALECPLDPRKRSVMYTYWGDAIQVKHRGVHGPQLAIARRKAVVPYLKGLQDQLQLKLPDEKPELPEWAQERRTEGRQESYEQRLTKAKAKKEAFHRVWKRVRFEWKMIDCRNILISQIVFMYTRVPTATEELRKLASQIVKDKNLVDQIVMRVEQGIKDRNRKDRKDRKHANESTH